VQIFEKFVATLVLPIIVMGCSHVPSSEGTRQAETPYTWHDGSKQGLYGIGKDWSIEILPGEYGEITELLRFPHPTGGELIPVGAVYEWVKDDGLGKFEHQTVRVEYVETPPTYATVSETFIAFREDQYWLTPPLYDANGNIARPINVRQRRPITKTRERRVIKTPWRIEERMVPVVPREGYKLIEVSPATARELPHVSERYVTQQGEILPWRFPIRNPKGDIVHTFQDYGKLVAFINSLKLD